MTSTDLVPVTESGQVDTDTAPVRSGSPLTKQEVDLRREIFLVAFDEVLDQFEQAFADEMCNEPKPHRAELRLKLEGAVEALRTVMNLTGVRMAERLAQHPRDD